ncbi:MAG: NAD(P)-dependent alcohol dehydrogenase [Candidatus Sumerlaeaceae bacterium]|nr:NAD(P)-dependent alcohol dehydrogenase [Candidatus Sumerlaeaceae bacterium]
MRYKAYAATGPGGRLEAIEVETGTLGAHEVDIRVTHCGICHSDIHMIDNDWQMSQYPLVPGHEVIGVVEEVGSEVRMLKPGDRVGVGWMCSSCGQCEWCACGEEPCCPQNGATIVGHHGGFAERVRADERFAFVIPEEISSAEAGPLLCGGITVWTPLRRDARPTSRVGVIGIGGLGHLAVLFARAMGCEVTAFSTSPSKESEARKFGAHHFVVSTDPQQMARAVGSLDLLISAVTVDLDWPAIMGLLRPKGVLAIVGASPGPVAVPAFSLIVGDRSVRGSAIGGRPAIREMLQFAARSGVRPQVEVMPLDRVNDALDRVRQNRARYRMVLEV